LCDETWQLRVETQHVQERLCLHLQEIDDIPNYRHRCLQNFVLNPKSVQLVTQEDVGVVINTEPFEQWEEVASILV